MQKWVVVLLLCGCVGPAQLERYADQVNQTSRASLKKCYDQLSCKQQMPCLVATARASLVIREANGRFRQASHYVVGALAGRVKSNIKQVETACGGVR